MRFRFLVAPEIKHMLHYAAARMNLFNLAMQSIVTVKLVLPLTR